MLKVTNSAKEVRTDTCEKHVYQVIEVLDSPPSALIFTAYEQENRQQKIVLKVLRAYEDMRYHQATSIERLECQREALRKNLTITPAIYLGLGPILGISLEALEESVCKRELRSLILGKMTRNINELDNPGAQNGAYALVMHYLPEKHRLNSLLREESPEKLRELLKLLVKRVFQMHESLLPLGASRQDEYGNLWGSYRQLTEKLEHNLKHFDLIKQFEHKLYQQYIPLRDTLCRFILHPKLKEVFTIRQPRYVKQCHGDLKASNIWVERLNQQDDLVQLVSILDAVDFNESYRNIDVLADLAMLVVDIEAYGTASSENDWRHGPGDSLATGLIKEYLGLTEQAEDMSAIVALAYYLIEKAIVRAIVCLVYDRDERELGQRFLDIASRHAETLSRLL